MIAGWELPSKDDRDFMFLSSMLRIVDYFVYARARHIVSGFVFCWHLRAPLAGYDRISAVLVVNARFTERLTWSAFSASACALSAEA